MGGQNAKIDVVNKVAFAYVCNGLKSGVSDYVVTFMRLQKALYDCLDENNLLTDDLSEKSSTLNATVDVPSNKRPTVDPPIESAADKSQVQEMLSTKVLSDNAPSAEKLIVADANDKQSSKSISLEVKE